MNSKTSRFHMSFTRPCSLGLLAVLLLLASASTAVAAPPTHPALPGLGINGFDHACGTAVDSEGNVYVSSAADDEIKIFDSEHNPLGSITESEEEPCGLAVDSNGNLYVSERAVHEVVKYHPTEYPFSGAPSYGPPQTVNAGGKAEGIAVDPYDDRLYVAEGDRISVYQADGTQGQNKRVRLIVGRAVIGGAFTIGFEGETTAPIEVVPGSKPTPAEVQAALEALPAIGAGNVSVREADAGTRSYFVTFTHALGSKNVPTPTTDSSGLSGGSASFAGAPIEGLEFDGHIAEGDLTDATAVAAYTYYRDDFDPAPRRYLFAADAATDEVEVISGTRIDQLEPKYAIDGKAVPNSPACPGCSTGFDFGPQGGALATDWVSGHVFVYDSGHGVLDEFEAGGRYLDQIASPAFADALPSGVAVLPERSAIQELSIDEGLEGGTFALGYEGAQTGPLPYKGSAAEVEEALEALPGIGAGNVSVRVLNSGGEMKMAVTFTGALAGRRVGDIVLDVSGLVSVFPPIRTVRLPGAGPGRIYVTAGPGAGAKLLAFGPLAAPSREELPPFIPGSLATARAVATDSYGNVYVRAGALIHVYRHDGTEIKIGAKGKGIEDNNEPLDLAVDSTGRVYVLDADKDEVTYYTPSAYPPVDGTTYARRDPAISPPFDAWRAVAVDPKNDHVFITTQAQAFELDSAAPGHDSEVLDPCFACGFELGQRKSMAIHGASGNVYFANQGNDSLISVVNPEGTEIKAGINGTGSPEGRFNVSPFVAVDQVSGHLIETQAGETAREYEPSGAFVAEFGSFSSIGIMDVAIDNACALHDPPLDESTTPTCREFDPANGNVYVVSSAPGPANIFAFGPLKYGGPPVVSTGIADGIGAGDATLRGTVDPAGFELEGCRFEYLADADYRENLKDEDPGFEGAQAQDCAETLPEIGNGNGAVAVHADLAGLDPDGRYSFRLVADNTYGSGEGARSLFGPPVLTPKSALPVLYDEATLRANVDPAGLATAYRFEYGKAAGEYDRSTPEGKLAPTAGPTDLDAPLTGLEEGTEYHFRVVAENEAKIVPGPDQTLITRERAEPQSCDNAKYRTGLSANLPDCRAYELVTPAQTNGAAPFAAGNGSAGTAKAGFVGSWLVTPRGPAAGERVSYFTGATLPGFDGNGFLDGYRAQRAAGEHPEGGWTSTLFGPTYLESAPDFSHTVFQEGVASDQLYSLWRVNPAESSPGALEAGVYLRTPTGFEPLGRGTLGIDLKAEGHYISPGGGHVIFRSTAQLEPGAPPAPVEAIYERQAGAASADVVSVAPPAPSEPSIGEEEEFEELSEEFETKDARYVGSSEDGTAIVFKLAGALYLHRGGETIAISSAPSTFAGISEAGNRVFYAQTEGVGAARIYTCDVEAAPCVGGAEPPPGLSEIAEDSIFVSVSPDGSRALFTSKAALTGSEENAAGESAEATKHNLYGWDSATDTVSFVAQLDPEDFKDQGFGQGVNMSLGLWTGAINPGPGSGRAQSPTRSSPDGDVFVFQSHARLSAYDNEGQGEIYRYEPGAALGERLLCVSCDPSGAPASANAMLVDILKGVGVTMTTLVANLSDDGQRVFFQSPDRLQPEDANGASDVYEWTAEGAGGCKREGGCLALISSGQGEAGSYLFGMSADGEDVFFRTNEKLVGADVPGSPSIYDARVEGGIPDPATKAPCRGDACQGEGGTPPALPGPGSAALQAGSNAGQERSPRCRKSQRRVVRKGRARCVRRHHKSKKRTDADRRPKR